MPRLFFSIPIPTLLHESLASTIAQLKKQDLHQAIRWSPIQNWHITLCFLGGVPDEKVSSCIQCAQHALQDIPPFELTLGQLTTFSHGRMLVIQISPSPQLNEAHRLLKAAMTSIGLTIESREIFPHITLGKFSSSHHATAEFLENIKTVAVSPNQTFSVEKIELLQSDITHHGSTYQLLYEVPLHST